MRRRLSAGAVALLVGLAAWAPDPAAAHGLVARADLPIPQWLFAWAATLVLVASFVGLAALWRRPRLERAPARPLLRIPAWLDAACGVVGVAIFALVVYSGLAGPRSSAANLAPTFVYVLLWVGVAPLSALLGDVFRAFNPWRAVARAAAWAIATTRATPNRPLLTYPERLGRWPAAAGLFGFAWLELVYSNSEDPRVIAVLALVYAALQLAAMAVFGIERWSDRGDAFGVYFNLFARLSPLVRRGADLCVTRPLSRVAGLTSMPGTVALLCVMIGSTSFDGASRGALWTSVAPDLVSVFSSIGVGDSLAIQAAYTIGLIASVLVIASLYRLGVSGMQSVGGASTRAGELAGRFAHTLVPIALAYVVAHYFSLLVYQGQAAGYLFSDPLGRGWDLLGLSSSGIDYGVISATGIWYVQVGALVIGHVTGLALAHDRSLVLYRRAEQATRSQYWMLAVMVGYTSLGLWLLSATG